MLLRNQPKKWIEEKAKLQHFGVFINRVTSSLRLKDFFGLIQNSHGENWVQVFRFLNLEGLKSEGDQQQPILEAEELLLFNFKYLLYFL
jgi:hypothetical protein